jgi:hypothetical protein
MEIKRGGRQVPGTFLKTRPGYAARAVMPGAFQILG